MWHGLRGCQDTGAQRLASAWSCRKDGMKQTRAEWDDLSCTGRKKLVQSRTVGRFTMNGAVASIHAYLHFPIRYVSRKVPKVAQTPSGHLSHLSLVRLAVDMALGPLGSAIAAEEKKNKRKRRGA